MSQINYLYEQWLEVRNFIIEDSYGASDDNPELLNIPLSEKPIVVCRSNSTKLNDFIQINGQRWHRVDGNMEKVHEEWFTNDEQRNNVLRMLLDLIDSRRTIPETTDDTFFEWMFTILCNELRMLPNLAISHDQSTFSNPKLSLRVELQDANSILEIILRLFPLFRLSIPLTLVTSCREAPMVSFLVNHLIQLGFPRGVVNHLIDPVEIKPHGNTAFFILMETGDIDSVFDQMVKCYFSTHLTCIKLFAHEALESKLEKIFQYKQKQSLPNSMKSFINLMNVDVQHSEQGVNVFYYRTYEELLNMVNHLQQMGSTKRAQMMSVWSTDVSLAYNIIKQFKPCDSIWINCFRILDDYHLNNKLSLDSLNVLKANELTKMLKGVDIKSSEWPSIDISRRYKHLNSILSKLKTRSSIRFSLNQSMNCEMEDDSLRNIINLRRYDPVGQIIVQLGDNSSASTLFNLFIFNALLAGNTLVLIGSSSQLMFWEEMGTFDLNALQLIELNVKEGPVGISQIVNENGTSTGVYINDCLEDEALKSILKRLSRNVYISLPEYTMSKLIE